MHRLYKKKPKLEFRGTRNNPGVGTIYVFVDQFGYEWECIKHKLWGTRFLACGCTEPGEYEKGWIHPHCFNHRDNPNQWELGGREYGTF